jgi:hypothetical protein
VYLLQDLAYFPKAPSSLAVHISLPLQRRNCRLQHLKIYLNFLLFLGEVHDFALTGAAGRL